MAAAQENNVSPYSMFGPGDIQYGESGRTSGMASTSVSLAGSHFLNTVNPAALTALDTNSFIFDITGSARGSVFRSGTVKNNTFSANFTRVTAGLRFTPRWSAALSLQPYSTVCYKIEDQDFIEGSVDKTVTTFEGSGGITRLSLINSFRLTQKFSVGADMMILFSNIDRDVSQSGITINQNSSGTTFSFSLGMLYREALSEKLFFTAGVVYGHRSNLIFNNLLQVHDASGNILFNDVAASTDLTIPGIWSAGFSLAGKRLLAAADYHYQRWSMARDKDPVSFTDTHKFSVGIAFIPSLSAPKNYFELIEYQAGFTVSNSYLILNGVNPVNFELSAATGLPLRGGGQITIGFAWGNKGTISEGLIREDYLRLTLSLSMVERMFLKRMYN
jgi:hypothetical protein